MAAAVLHLQGSSAQGIGDARLSDAGSALYAAASDAAHATHVVNVTSNMTSLLHAHAEHSGDHMWQWHGAASGTVCCC
jgi:hypothetical protein